MRIPTTPPALGRPRRTRLGVGGLLMGVAGLTPWRGAVAAEEAMGAIPAGFLEQRCYGCHDALEQKGRLDLTALRVDAAQPDEIATWVRVHDRVLAGEMPPKKEPRPEPAELRGFVDTLAQAIIATEHATIARDGRARQRRLNRDEYENALRDLLGVPWARIKDRLPPDGEAYRYNKSGEALDVSHVQLARYLEAADHALRQAISVAYESRPATTTRYYARAERSLTRNFWPRENGTLSDRLAFPVLDGRAQPDVRAGRAPVSDPAAREREAVGKVASTFSDAGGYGWNEFRAPVGGRYRLRFRGYSLWVSGGGIARWFYEGQGDAKAPVYHLPLWHRPNLEEIWPGRRDEPIGVYATLAGQRRVLGEFDFTPEPITRELEVVLAQNEIIQTDGSRLFRTRVNGTDEQYVNPLAQPDGMPGYAIQWMEVEGPLPGATMSNGYRLLFGELPLRRLDPAAGVAGLKLDVVPARPPDGARTGGGFGFNPPLEQIFVDVLPEDAARDGERLLRGFMQRAYRRPVEEPHVQRFLALFHDQLGLGRGFAKSLLAAATAVLASPGFLYIEEAPGRLDDHALATRLALFLWNSEPDPELRALAARGALGAPEVLRAQTERLLDDPRSRRFVDAFTDFWLDLRKIDDTTPSPTLYNDYELDDPLKQAAIAETRLFVAGLLREDRPAREIVDCDYAYLNERLARHYGVPGVRGAALRRVPLPAGRVRGGLLTQASVLKVTANGTTTSPVLRGHWITERILGYQTPPPPPVPAIEPDIRGAVTIRQQLDRHRADPSCASCHARMDPPGFALESFDVMGGWRDRYRAAKEGVPAERGIGLNGQAFAFHHALPVDAAGELPDGRTFTDVREFKQLLLADEAVIARNLVRQLSIYATGAPVRFSDRAAIEAILAQTRSREYGVRSIVHAIVAGEMFLQK